jgi:hypothetical protein
MFDDTMGKFWEKDNKKRFYFKPGFLMELVDFQVSFYKTGNISGCNRLSNGKASKVFNIFENVYYDFSDKTFNFRREDDRFLIDEGKELIKELKEKLKEEINGDN